MLFRSGKRLVAEKEKLRKSLNRVGIAEASVEEAMHDPGPVYAHLLAMEDNEPETPNKENGETSHTDGNRRWRSK